VSNLTPLLLLLFYSVRNWYMDWKYFYKPNHCAREHRY